MNSLPLNEKVCGFSGHSVLRGLVPNYAYKLLNHIHNHICDQLSTDAYCYCLNYASQVSP